MSKTKVIELLVKCPACDGTGLYVGMAERDGAAVVCSKCDGTGAYTYKYSYEPFVKSLPKEGVRHVYKVNPGWVIGENTNLHLKDFGGMPFEDWEKGKSFPQGSEMRCYVCPYQWYQTGNTYPKPKWDWCEEGLGRTFKECPHFQSKELCWKRWDNEHNKEEKESGI